MKKFLALSLAAAAALTLAAKEINLGLPTMEKNKGWSIYFQNSQGTVKNVDFLGKKCALVDVASKNPKTTNAACNRWFNGLQKVTAIRVTFYTEDVNKLVLRVMDNTKQTHQFYFNIKPGKKWQTVTFDLAKANKRIWYQGANDHVWHAPAKMASLIFDIEPNSRIKRDNPQAKLYVAEFTVIGE